MIRKTIMHDRGNKLTVRHTAYIHIWARKLALELADIVRRPAGTLDGNINGVLLTDCQGGQQGSGDIAPIRNETRT